MTDDTNRPAPSEGAVHSRRAALRRLAWAVPTVTALQLAPRAVLAQASAPPETVCYYLGLPDQVTGPCGGIFLPLR